MLTPEVPQATRRFHARSDARSAGRRRSTRLIGAGVALALVVGSSACTADINAAAVVGGTPIASTRIDERAAEGLVLVGQPAGPAAGLSTSLMNETLIDAGRLELNSQIRHQILVAAGLDQNLDQAALSTLAEQLGGVQAVLQQLNIVREEDVLPRLNDLAAEASLVAAAVRSGEPVSVPAVTFDVILVADYEAALALKAEYDKDPAALTAAAASGSPQAAAVDESVTADQAPVLISTGIFSAKVDQILAFDLGGQGYVARIKSAGTAAKPLEQSLMTQPDPGTLSVVAGLLLSDLAADVSVEVNPRYGVWDPTTMQVISEPGRR